MKPSLAQCIRTMRPSGLLLLLLPGLGGCSGAPSPPATPPPVVTIALPVEKRVIDHVDFSGQTAAMESVQLRARVGGYLEKVSFKEGDQVGVGQTLFEIDRRSYQAELQQAEAQVKGIEAQVTRTQNEFDRVTKLYNSRSVTQADVDKAERARDVAVASLDVARANVELKHLNLGYCEVKSPIKGRADKAEVTVGNLISANLSDATVLTTIVTWDPIYAYFDIDELTMLRVQQMRRAGKVGTVEEKPPEVLLGLGNGTDYPFKGKLDFTGNQVNPSTGTLSARAVYDNSDFRLSPGLFARMRVMLGESHPAILVNDRAVGTNRGQKYLFILNEKNEVTYRPVTLGGLHDGLREVLSGLKGGERVVVNGLLRVRPGVTVDPKAGQMIPEPIHSDTVKPSKAATGGQP